MIVAAGLASIAAGVWWAQADVTGGTGPSGAAPSNAVLTTGLPVPSSTGAPSPSGPSNPDTAQAWVQELVRLDAVRAAAYEQNRSDLLVQMYQPGALLDQDAAQLRAQVPDGCGLVGAVTTYSQLNVAATAEASATLEVTASLASAELRCGGAMLGSSSDVGPTRLAITLARQSDGTWRITQQRRTS